jgi:hypothetical protein
MTTYTWPDAMQANAFEAQLVPNVRGFSSPYGGSSQALDLLGERWRFAIGLPACKRVDSGVREALFAKLRGGANRVSLWHMARPVPVGTMRGAPTLASTAAQGASTISINASAGSTIKAGDVLGLFGGYLVMAAADATEAGGVISLTLSNRLRASVASGSVVTWNKPTAEFMLSDSGGVPIQHMPVYSPALQCEFMEAW